METTKRLKQDGFPDVHWLIGADSVPRLPTWFGYPHLLDEVCFVVMLRPGTTLDWERLEPRLQSLRSRVVPAPLIDISASDIRQRVREGRSITGLVPESVKAYIEQHKLYQNT